MSFMDMFRVNEIKAELTRTVKERDSLKKAFEDGDKMVDVVKEAPAEQS